MRPYKDDSEIGTTTRAFGRPADAAQDDRYILCLYISGLTARSSIAIERIRTICEMYLVGRYELTVIDLYLHPALARLAQIIVCPTLVKNSPTPIRLFVGDMADEKTILHGLNIAARTLPCH